MAMTCVSAKPGLLTPLAAVSPIVTATSSQVVARNYNGLAAPLVAAPIAYSGSLGYASPYLASPYIASPYAAAAYSPYFAAGSPLVNPYAAAAYSPYYGGAAIASPVAPLKYTAAPVLL